MRTRMHWARKLQQPFGVVWTIEMRINIGCESIWEGGEVWGKTVWELDSPNSAHSSSTKLGDNFEETVKETAALFPKTL